MLITTPPPSMAHHPEAKSYKVDLFQPSSWGLGCYLDGSDLSSWDDSSNCPGSGLQPPSPLRFLPSPHANARVRQPAPVACSKFLNDPKSQWGFQGPCQPLNLVCSPQGSRPEICFSVFMPPWSLRTCYSHCFLPTCLTSGQVSPPPGSLS